MVLPVCPDRGTLQAATIIVSRILTILAESKGIWPLASGWYEHLDGFHKAPASQAATGTATEHTMADSVSTGGSSFVER